MLHLIGRGNDSIRLFRNRRDFFRFKQTLLRFLRREHMAIHHYALMHTHFHLLAWVPNTERLAAAMKAMAISYEHSYRRKYRHKGHLWHSRYRSIVIMDDAHWLQCGRYIELNPVHAGICRDPKNFPWSSYHYYAHGREDELIQPEKHPPLEIIGEKEWRREYRNFILAGIHMDYEKMKKRYERECFRQ